MISRFILISAVVLLYWYLGHQLTQYAELSAWATYSIWFWLLLVLSLVLFLPLYFWQQRRMDKVMSPRLHLIMHISHLVMAYVNFLIPSVMIRDLLGFIEGVVLKENSTWLYSANASFVLMLLPFLFKAWGALTVYRGPLVLRREVQDHRLAKEFSGLRILQISDLHISHSLKKGFVEQVIEKTLKLKPDVVVLTGDIVDGAADEFQEEIAKLSQLEARHGIFYVPGNHEYYWGFDKIKEALTRAGIVSLTNSHNSLRGLEGEILIAGIPDPAAAYFGDEGPQIHGFQNHFSENQYRILLSHQPDLADQAAQAGFHFQLSGHTHGGQFFPWNFLIGFFQKYPKGLFRIQDMHLYVNQGTGYWGPALRVGTYCELTEIVLQSPEAS